MKVSKALQEVCVCLLVLIIYIFVQSNTRCILEFIQLFGVFCLTCKSENKYVFFSFLFFLFPF